MRASGEGRRFGNLLGPCLLATLLSCAPGATESPSLQTQDPSVVFLVRHAEKVRDGSPDPDLTDEGRNRAELLAVMLAEVPVTHLYSTELLRTRATLEPLSRATGLPITVISSGETHRQVEALRDLPSGSVAVVAGHSNTVPALIRELGGEVRGTTEHPEYGSMLGDQEYDRLFEMILPPAGSTGSPITLELRYGEPARSRP